MESNEETRLTDEEFSHCLKRTIEQAQSDDFLNRLLPGIAKQRSLFLDLLKSLEVFFKQLGGVVHLLTLDTKSKIVSILRSDINAVGSSPHEFVEFRFKVETIYTAYKECFIFAKKSVSPDDVEKHALRLIQVDEKTWGNLKHSYEHFSFWTLRDLVEKYKNYDDINAAISTVITNLKTKVDAQKTTVSDLEKRIDELKSGVAFVELTKAFIGLKDEQVKRWKITFWICFAVFLGLIAIPTYLHFCNKEIKEISDWLKYLQYVWPFVAVEFFLIYGFRIVYSNLKSTDAQITQLEIRIALCQFIDGYKTFVNNTHDKQPIEKFESLVFSGLSMDASDIPTTFDGLDQVSKIVEAFKSAKP